MTERKRWPNEAENARLESIAQARRGVAAVRRAAQSSAPAALVDVVDALHTIIENLTSVGPGQEQKKTAMLSA